MQHGWRGTGRPAAAARLALVTTGCHDLIPDPADIDPFNRSDFFRQQGACRAVVPRTISDAQRGWREKAPGPSGGSWRPIGCVAVLARYASIAPRTAPARMNRYDPMKWVDISGIWY